MNRDQKMEIRSHHEIKPLKPVLVGCQMDFDATHRMRGQRIAHLTSPMTSFGLSVLWGSAS